MAAKIMRKRGVPRRKNIKEKSRHGPVNVRVLVYSFIVTIVLYAFMLFIERSVLLSETEPTNIPWVSPLILLGGMRLSIWVLIDVETS